MADSVFDGLGGFIEEIFIEEPGGSIAAKSLEGL